MQRRIAWVSLIPPGILVVSLFWIYLATIAPGLSWAHDGSDGGDLITAAVTGSVAHPSGYPLYMLLARGFQFLPLGSLAFRTNLMSALFGVLTALLVYVLVVKSTLEELKPYQKYLAGLSAGYAICLAPLFWSQAIITEVYTLHAFFIALIMVLVVMNTSLTNQNHMDRLRGVIYGLAAGNHLTSILMIPAAILASCLNRISLRSRRPLVAVERSDDIIAINWQSVLRQMLWVLLGLSVYAILPLRARTQPVINWGNPVNLNNFWWLVSGQVYRSYYLPDSLSQWWPGIQASASLFLQQFGLVGLALGFTGLVMTFRLSRIYFITIWTALVFSIVTIAYQSNDAYVYFIPVVISFSVWIGLGVGYIFKSLAKWHKAWSLLFVIILMTNYCFGLISNWQIVDASKDYRAENFGKQVVITVPKNAIIFTEGDRATFALWYFHFAQGQRPDVSVVAADLLHWDWYLESLKTTYPTLVLDTPFPWPSTIVEANPDRPACYVSYTDRTEISCDEN